jgi:hypothetical protein
MAQQPDLIVLGRHRDMKGRRKDQWVRRALLLVILAFALAGLANVFGPRSSNAAKEGADATLEIRSPTAIRGGMLYQARFVIEARRELKQATLVLGRGWFEGMTVNTIEPSPIGEASRDGKVVFELGHVPEGDKHVLYVQLQVNPNSVGLHGDTVELWDGNRRILAMRRTMKVFP